MKDLNADKRILGYWWRANKDTVLLIGVLVLIVFAFGVFPSMGLYQVS